MKSAGAGAGFVMASRKVQMPVSCPTFYVHMHVSTSPSGRPMSNAPAAAPALDPRTRLLLEGPIASTLLRLAVPTMVVMVAQAAAGLIETYFVGKLGTS